jgi:F0F1-type ATP synthase assembly protein I
MSPGSDPSADGGPETPSGAGQETGRPARERRTPGESLPLLGLGFSTASIVGFTSWLGYLADQRYETRPWLLVVGSLLGVVVAMADLLMTVRRHEKVRRAAREAEPGGKKGSSS